MKPPTTKWIISGVLHGDRIDIGEVPEGCDIKALSAEYLSNRKGPISGIQVRDSITGNIIQPT
jgi:hypothetical protein